MVVVDCCAGVSSDAGLLKEYVVEEDLRMWRLDLLDKNGKQAGFSCRDEEVEGDLWTFRDVGIGR